MNSRKASLTSSPSTDDLRKSKTRFDGRRARRKQRQAVHNGRTSSTSRRRDASQQNQPHRSRTSSMTSPSPLDKATVEYLTQNTRYGEAEIREWHDGFKADCPDGKLRKQKVVDMYSLLLPQVDTTAFVDQIFRLFDRDGNGCIDFVEFMLATDMTVAGSAEEKLSWAFKLYDKDNSGAINVDEMIDIFTLLLNLGSTTSGASGLPQAKQAEIEEQQRKCAERARIIFARLDVNGDGDLTQEEFVQGCREDEELVHLLTNHDIELLGGDDSDYDGPADNDADCNDRCNATRAATDDVDNIDCENDAASSSLAGIGAASANARSRPSKTLDSVVGTYSIIHNRLSDVHPRRQD